MSEVREHTRDDVSSAVGCLRGSTRRHSTDDRQNRQPADDYSRLDIYAGYRDESLGCYGGQDIPADGDVPPRDWRGAQMVERVVLVGPPNAGSLQILDALVRGHRFGIRSFRYSSALPGTFPSMYEALPRSRHRAVVDAVMVSRSRICSIRRSGPRHDGDSQILPTTLF